MNLILLFVGQGVSVALPSAVSASSTRSGTASWYSVASTIREGTGGPRHLMANGRPLNDQAFTAALRSYDFGKRYRVTNIKTRKSVIVTHTDYGPSKRLKDRVIDLSRAAFSEIADLRDGLCEVTVVLLP